MKYYSIFCCLASFFCLSLVASEPPQSELPKFDASSRFNEKCVVTYNKADDFPFSQGSCQAVKELFETMKKEDPSKRKKISHFQICFVSNQGVKQCGMSQQNMSCERAIQLIAKAQAVCKPE
jgi:hypothetical protein